MDEEKCPYCQNFNCLPGVLFNAVESHGGGSFHIPCIQCGKMIKVSASRTVVINSITKSDHTEGDF